MRVIISMLACMIVAVRAQNCPSFGNIALQDPSSCTQFIRCTNGRGQVERCAFGTAFDIVAGQCTLAAMTACNDKNNQRNPCQGNPSTGVLLVASQTHCDRYTMCVGQERTERTCPANSHFNATIGACDTIKNARCQLPDNNPFPCENNPSGTVTFIKSTTHCDRFIMCIGQTRRDEICPENSHFNARINACDTIANAQCSIADSLPVPCADNAPGAVSFVASRTHCDRYIMCIGTTPNNRECAANSHFNSRTNKCDTIANARCAIFQNNPANLCATNPAGTVLFVPNRSQCDRYTMCIGTTRQDRQCPVNTHFNERISSCDTIANARCRPASSQQPIATTEAACNTNETFEMLPSTLSCDRYTICASGTAHRMECGPGMVFDIRQQQCNLSSNGAMCLSEFQPRCPQNGAAAMLAHPRDCRHYFQCARGTATLVPCSAGLHFNRITSQCEPISQAKCTISM